MRFITREEYATLRLYELDNNIWNAIERSLADAIGWDGAKRFLNKHMYDKVSALDCTGFDLLKSVKIL